MPTQATTYNSRVTDEALEKRFRDTFRSQGGAELVDDLYAQGVIVPVVDFTAAATGQQLSQNLQTAWDFSTGFDQVINTSTTIINNAGFWKIDLTWTNLSEAVANNDATIAITDGLSSKPIYKVTSPNLSLNEAYFVDSASFVVFVRSGDSVTATTARPASILNVWYRQIATVSGDLVDPSGFTPS